MDKEDQLNGLRGSCVEVYHRYGFHEGKLTSMLLNPKVRRYCVDGEDHHCHFEIDDVEIIDTNRYEIRLCGHDAS